MNHFLIGFCHFLKWLWDLIKSDKGKGIVKEAWTFLHFVLSCVSPRTDSAACGWEQRHCGWPHSILGRAEPPEATRRWECHLGTRNSFFGGLFTGFWNHGKWKCEMRQAHAVYSNTWWLNNVGRQQMGSECCVCFQQIIVCQQRYIFQKTFTDFLSFLLCF